MLSDYLKPHRKSWGYYFPWNEDDEKVWDYFEALRISEIPLSIPEGLTIMGLPLRPENVVLIGNRLGYKKYNNDTAIIDLLTFASEALMDVKSAQRQLKIKAALGGLTQKLIAAKAEEIYEFTQTPRRYELSLGAYEKIPKMLLSIALMHKVKLKNRNRAYRFLRKAQSFEGSEIWNDSLANRSSVIAEMIGS